MGPVDLCKARVREARTWEIHGFINIFYPIDNSRGGPLDLGTPSVEAQGELGGPKPQPNMRRKNETQGR
jgi:hypothetical protein